MDSAPGGSSQVVDGYMMVWNMHGKPFPVVDQQAREIHAAA